MRRVARQAAGFNCDVFVTDHPAWHKRLAVPAAFEARIRRTGATRLACSEHPAEINWTKEVPAPVTTEDELYASLNSAVEQLALLPDRFGLGAAEQQALDRNSPNEAEGHRRKRAKATGGDAAMGIELALKALRKALLPQAKAIKTHYVDEVIVGLDADLVEEIEDLFANHGVDLENLGDWRENPFYDDMPKRTWDQLVTEVDSLMPLACEVMQLVNRYVAANLSGGDGPELG